MRPSLISSAKKRDYDTAFPVSLTLCMDTGPQERNEKGNRNEQKHPKQLLLGFPSPHNEKDPIVAWMHEKMIRVRACLVGVREGVRF